MEIVELRLIDYTRVRLRSESSMGIMFNYYYVQLGFFDIYMPRNCQGLEYATYVCWAVWIETKNEPDGAVEGVIDILAAVVAAWEVVIGTVAKVEVDWTWLSTEMFGKRKELLSKWMEVGIVDWAAELEVAEIKVVAGGGLAQIDAKLFESADASYTV
jgi:hypothetical protein